MPDVDDDILAATQKEVPYETVSINPKFPYLERKTME